MATPKRSDRQQQIIDLQHYLKGVDYPANREELLDAAERNGATPEIIEVIEGLEDDRYDTPADVMKAWGQAN